MLSDVVTKYFSSSPYYYNSSFHFISHYDFHALCLCCLNALTITVIIKPMKIFVVVVVVVFVNDQRSNLMGYVRHSMMYLHLRYCPLAQIMSSMKLKPMSMWWW